MGDSEMGAEAQLNLLGPEDMYLTGDAPLHTFTVFDEPENYRLMPRRLMEEIRYKPPSEPKKAIRKNAAVIIDPIVMSVAVAGGAFLIGMAVMHMIKR